MHILYIACKVNTLLCIIFFCTQKVIIIKDICVKEQFLSLHLENKVNFDFKNIHNQTFII